MSPDVKHPPSGRTSPVRAVSRMPSRETGTVRAGLGRPAGRALAGVLVLALSPIAGLAALAGTALVGTGPDVFTVAGLAVFASVLFLGLLLCVPRPRAVWGRWLRAAVVLGVEAAVVWQVSAATLN
ncbi:hypothetical protein ACWEPC_58970, partial [Nonomuraea sp. NPDC004297]